LSIFKVFLLPAGLASRVLKAGIFQIYGRICLFERWLASIDIKIPRTESFLGLSSKGYYIALSLVFYIE